MKIQTTALKIETTIIWFIANELPPLIFKYLHLLDDKTFFTEVFSGLMSKIIPRTLVSLWMLTVACLETLLLQNPHSGYHYSYFSFFSAPGTTTHHSV